MAKTPEPAEAVQPRYAKLARQLATDIVQGRHPVGTMLPTEHELCALHGVSRATVREALRRLAELGLVSRGQGVGTRVIAEEPRANYVLQARSAIEVIGHTGEMHLRIDRRHTVQADEELAAFLGVAPGTPWLHLTALRMLREAGELPVALVEYWVDPRFAAVTELPAVEHTPIWRLIEQEGLGRIADIRQEVTAISLTSVQARQLQSRNGAPGLHVVRHYLDETGAPLQVTRNVHPGERFTYLLRLQRS